MKTSVAICGFLLISAVAWAGERIIDFTNEEDLRIMWEDVVGRTYGPVPPEIREHADQTCEISLPGTRSVGFKNPESYLCMPLIPDYTEGNAVICTALGFNRHYVQGSLLICTDGRAT